MIALHEKKTAEELAVLIEKEEVKIEELSLNRIKHREAYFTALKRRPALLTKIVGPNAQKILKYTIDNVPSYFIYLKKEQYTDELAQRFLLFRLSEVDKNEARQAKSDFVTIQTSLDNKVLLNYAYVSKEGDEVFYFDNELEVPSSLKYAYKATLKITDAITLINKLDLHITQLGKNKIKNTLTDIFDNKFKVFISEYLSKNKAGYYTLCANVDSVEEAFKQSAMQAFEPYGIELGEFIIKKFAIPKDIQNKIEDQFFRIRQQKADAETNNELARKSLEIYETKLAIENKYPEGIHSLTEYEKDLALKRYLVKNGFNPNEEVNRNVSVVDTKEKLDTTIDKKKDVVPEVPEKTNTARVAFISLLVISLFIAMIVTITNAGSGMVILGIIALVFGLIGVGCYDKLKKNPEEIKENKTTEDSTLSPKDNNEN